MSLDLFVETFDRIKPTLKLMTEFANAIENFQEEHPKSSKTVILAFSPEVGAVFARKDKPQQPHRH